MCIEFHGVEEAYKRGKKEERERIRSLLTAEFDGSDNPMLREYTRGFNAARAEMLRQLDEPTTEGS